MKILFNAILSSFLFKFNYFRNCKKIMLKKMWLMLFPGLLIANLVLAQPDTTTITSSDSGATLNSVEKFKFFANEVLNKSRKRFTDKQLIELQKQKSNQLNTALKEIETFFKKGTDTLTLINRLTELEELYLVTTDGINTNNSKFQSLRNLTSTAILLRELQKKLESLNKSLTTYRKAIEKRRNHLDSLTVDSILYLLPSDTNMFSAYEAGYRQMLTLYGPADSLLNNAKTNLLMLQDRTIKLQSDLSYDIFRVDGYRKKLSMSMFKREVSPVFSEEKSAIHLSEILSFSFFKAYFITIFYFENHPGFFFLILLMLCGTYYFFSLVRKRIFADAEFSVLHKQNEITEYPFISALFIVLNLGQFIFTYPPFVLQAIIWLVLSFLLIILHRKNPGIFGSRIWIYLIVFFILAIFDNLILETSVGEKWFLMTISIASIFLATGYLKHRKQLYSGIPIVKWMLYLFIILESAAFIAILFGRYNLSKTLFTTGYFAVISGIFLYWTYHFLLKALNTYSKTLTLEDSKSVFAKIKLAHDKSPRLYVSIFVFGWFVLFLRNFYLYTTIVSSLNDFLSAERAIGKYTFTLQSIFIFILVLFLSGLLSKIISLLTDNSSQQPIGPVKKKGGISNWLLLIRLAIIIIGVLLAFAAAGIPMNKLTIIIGSLGVGIGFGLQSIVNNLISGVVLAFERPIEIGDQIEIAGRTGRIKEIGIRSSKMVNLDGAEVIIPNGDMLNQHVINWTLSNNHRRVELIVGVKYGTDLQLAKNILDEILMSNNRIEKFPPPAVLLHQFNSSSVDFRLLFWCDIDVWVELKSEIILGIDKAFREAKIEIPYAQQNIYIKEFPDVKKDANQ
jgi:small-conductance mechanosensitive channel